MLIKTILSAILISTAFAADSYDFKCSPSLQDIVCVCSSRADSPSRFGKALVSAAVSSMEGKDGARNIDTIILEGCSRPAKVRLDLSSLYLDNLPNVRRVLFRDVSPVSVYFNGGIMHGDITVEFQNIYGSHDFYFSSKSGSVVLSGGVDFCSKPCSSSYTDPNAPPSLQSKCNDCKESYLHLKFNSVDHILLYEFAISSYAHLSELGGTTLSADNVKTFRVYEPFMSRVQNRGVNADSCWIDSKQVECKYITSGAAGLSAQLVLVVTALALPFANTRRPNHFFL